MECDLGQILTLTLTLFYYLFFSVLLGQHLLTMNPYQAWNTSTVVVMHTEI